MKLKVFLLLFLVFALAAVAYAQDDDDEDTVNLQDLPVQMSERLNIPLEAAEYLTGCLFLGWFLFPALLLSKDNVSQSIIVALFGLPIFGFAILMGWFDYWFLLIAAMLIALMYAGKARQWITGG